MSLLKKPSELSSNLVVKGLIYGQPGVGKSTLALSAPNPVLIDADQGIHRVDARHQVDSLPLESYAQVLELLRGNELNPYQSVVIDTLGKFVDKIGDYIVETNPKAKQGDGSLSMKGWGYLKTEFQNFLKLAAAKNKHLIFVAHEREEKDGDTRKMRPDVSGSSGKDIVKELDFMGYMEMRGDKHTISFAPSDAYYAKNSLKLDMIMDVPDPNKNPNDFIERVIIAKTIERQKQDAVLAEKYTAMMDGLKAEIEKIKSTSEADAAIVKIKSAGHIWDSEFALKKLLQLKAKSLGFEYNIEQAKFVASKKDEKPEATPEPEQESDELQQLLMAAE